MLDAIIKHLKVLYKPPRDPVKERAQGNFKRK